MSQQLDVGKRMRVDALSWIEIVVEIEAPDLVNSNLNIPGLEVLVS
jgi:hypothetical protein